MFLNSKDIKDVVKSPHSELSFLCNDKVPTI